MIHAHLLRVLMGDSDADIVGTVLQGFSAAVTGVMTVYFSDASNDLTTLAMVQAATPSMAYVYTKVNGLYGSPVDITPSLYNERICTVAVSGDGKTVVLGIAPAANPAIPGGPPGYFKFCVYKPILGNWELTNEVQIATRSGTSLYTCNVAVSYDGTMVAYAESANSAIHLYFDDAGSFNQVGTLFVTSYPTTLEMSSDGTRLFAGSIGESVSGVSSAGRVRYYKISPTELTLQSTIDSPNGNVANAQWGLRIASNENGTEVMIKNSSLTDTRIHRFTRSSETWTLADSIDYAPGKTTVRYAITSDFQNMVVGARTGSPSVASLLVYKRSGGVWNLIRTIPSPYAITDSDLDRNIFISSSAGKLLGISLKDPSNAAQTYVYYFD